MATSQLDELDNRTKAIVHHLYSLIVQATHHQGSQSSTAMLRELTTLTTSLSSLATLAPHLDPAHTSIPPDVLAYVSDGRNPDIYTRQHVELAHQNNQFLRGKSEGWARFGEMLGGEIEGWIPELEGEVARVGRGGRGEGGEGLQGLQGMDAGEGEGKEERREKKENRKGNEEEGGAGRG